MREPTAKQRQAYEAVVRLGSQVAAARELGWNPGAVRGAFRAYLEHTGQAWPEHVRRYRPWSPDRPALVIDNLRQRVRELEGRLALVEAERDTAISDRDYALGRLDRQDRMARIEAKLDQLLARPAVVASRRSITDGGEGEKHQRRRLARESRAA